MNRLAQLVRERLQPLSDSWSTAPLAPTMGVKPYSPSLTQLPSGRNNRRREQAGGVMIVEPMAAQKSSAPLQPSSQNHTCIVGSAALEFGLLPLHQQIIEFGRRLTSAGVKRLQLVPLFLLQGRHVMDDIPEEVDLARRELGGCIDIHVGDHIGGYGAMRDLIASRLASTPRKGRLLVAHGSRRPKGNRSVDQLAKSLGTAVAYWSNMSEIEDQTIQLMQQGCSTLTIFPYFLFAGGITDAVAHLTEELAERFPRTKFRLLPPLGATVDMADLVVDNLRS